MINLRLPEGNNFSGNGAFILLQRKRWSSLFLTSCAAKSGLTNKKVNVMFDVANMS